MSSSSESPFDRVVAILGSQRALAVACGVSDQAVVKWRRRIPAERVLQIEAAVSQRVTRYELRPDLYPPEGAAA